MRDKTATPTGALGRKIEPVRSIQQLIVVGHLDLRWLRRVRRRHPDSRTIFWGAALDNARALSSACALSQRVIVQDELVPRFSEHVQHGATTPLERLSDFDPKLARSCPEARVPEAYASDGKGVLVFDEKAKAAYQKRILKLQEEI